MSASVEGTGFNGEEKVDDNEVDETSEFYTCMIGYQAKPSLIKKLIANEYDSIEMIKAIGGDLDDVVQEAQLKVKEKINLKMILNTLSKQHSFVDPEEVKAITQMENKLKLMVSAIKLVTDTKQKINEEVTSHTKTIKATFKEFHSQLNKQETNLIKKLNKIANDKKNKLTNIEKNLNQQTNTSQQEINSCRKSLKQSIEIGQIEERKKRIINIATDMNKLKFITKDNPVIADSKIEIEINKMLLIETVNSTGFVYGVAPILITLTDNNAGAVRIKWKLSDDLKEENIHNIGSKIKVEWREFESKNDDNKYDDDMKVESKYNDKQEFKIENVEDVEINVKDGSFLFRIQYFDGETWSRYSNIKSIDVKAIDKWDENNVDKSFKIVGNKIIKKKETRSSAFLLNICSDGIHIWTFTLNKLMGINYALIGIWKTNSGSPTTSGWVNQTSCSSYGFIINAGSKLKYGGSYGDKGEDYGVKCKTGDQIEMKLDFYALSLSYKINGIDYGKCEDIERTAYRAVVCNYYEYESISLISYSKQ